MAIDLNTIIPILLTALIGVIGFLIRSYLVNIDRRIDTVIAMTNRRDGRLDTLIQKLDKNTEEITKLRYEIKAVWRFIDKVPKRASDQEAKYG